MAAKIVNYRDRVENVEIAWIPMPDGRRLAARLLLPKDKKDRPVPCIFEYIPYRRRDGTRIRDDETHYWFAAHGYGVARVDIAGSGDSDGLIQDEYHKREQDDALEIIDWLSKQDWCTGSVGMIGISWGGFNGLQVAARRPPALKAVVSIASTVDRYADDVHFMGGCLLNDTLDWGGYFFTCGSLPPDPEIVGHNRWKEIWKHRLDHLDCYPMLWMEHQRRDAFWKHGSVCEDYSRIEVPVLNVSGWVDGYTAAVFRCVENLPGAKGIAGPWGHKYPHVGIPGPAIGFLQECQRWFDRWLKGRKTGVEDDPPLRLFLQDGERPKPHFDRREGHWIGLPQWPSRNIKMASFHLGDETLEQRRSRVKPMKVKSSLSTGLTSGEWCAYGLGKIAPELAIDQREDDAQSLCFDGPVLKKPFAIVGRSFARLRVAADRPQAQVAVRLNAIHPDGAVERVTYGLLNLAHRDSHEKPSPLKPGKFYDVSVELNEIAQTVPAGCRLRLAISTSYWPIAWPSPEPATVTVDPSHSLLEVPRLVSEKGLAKVTFKPVEKATLAPVTVKDAGAETRHVDLDIETQRVNFIIRRNDGTFVIDDIGTEVSLTKLKDFAVSRDGSEAPRSLVATTVHYRRGDWDARAETEVAMTSDRTHFHLEGKVRTYEKGQPFIARDFKRSFKRDCV
ncbi:MAG: CocE/NonD family hydrolase [Rhizobiales bacterium]|nr:CocE/NonD family hydrolase [Hyphomicrobiales bacterium]